MVVGGEDRGAAISDDGVYRRSLWRVWDPALPIRGDGIYGSGLQRGDEIAAWLRASRRGRTQIVVLDDDDDMLAVAPWFVQTDAAVGLTPRNAARALTILRGRPWVDGGARRP